MIIDEQNKRIIFHNPKTGGTNLWKIYKQKYPQSIIKWKLPTKHEPDMGHLSLHNYQKYVNLRLPVSEYTYYVVVRDPIERFISGFNETKRHVNLSPRGIHTIDDMIQYMLRNPSFATDNSLVWICPQHLYTHNSETHPKVIIIPFNSLSEQAHTHFDINLVKPPTKRRTTNLNKAQIEQLRSIYSKDYQLLHNFFT